MSVKSMIKLYIEAEVFIDGFRFMTEQHQVSIRSGDVLENNILNLMENIKDKLNQTDKNKLSNGELLVVSGIISGKSVSRRYSSMDFDS